MAKACPDGKALVRSFHALMALMKSSREMRALMLESAAPGKGFLSRSGMVSVSRKVPGGILTSVPSGKWVVLKSMTEMPNSERGCVVHGVPEAALKWFW